MAEDIFVQDLRAADDPSLQPVPRSAVDTFEKLKAVFHLDVDTSFGWSITPPGQLCYKLIGFYLRTGPKAYIPHTRKEDGSPLSKIVVFRSWGNPGQEGAAPTPGEPARPSYFRNYVGGFTGDNGDIGFEYTGSSAFGDQGGPDRIWAAIDPPGQPVQYSDCAIRLGWHGATNHLTPNPIFQVTRKGSTTPPTDGSKRLVIYNADGSFFGAVNLTDGGGPAGTKRLVIEESGAAVAYTVLSE